MISDPEFLGRVKQTGTYFKDRLQALVEEFGPVREVRGLGLLLGLALDFPGPAVVEACREKGFLINCTQETILRFAPPLVVSRAEIDLLIETLREIFKEAVMV